MTSARGWLVPRLKPVVIDTHRRRRGAIGAQQRPRLPLPLWLDAALGGDPWLAELAVEIMRWVGGPTSADLRLVPFAEAADARLLAAAGEALDGIRARTRTPRSPTGSRSRSSNLVSGVGPDGGPLDGRPGGGGGAGDP